MCLMHAERGARARGSDMETKWHFVWKNFVYTLCKFLMIKNVQVYSSFAWEETKTFYFDAIATLYDIQKMQIHEECSRND